MQFSLTPYVLTFCFNNIIQRLGGLSLSVDLSSDFILGLRSPRSLLPSVKTVERAGEVRGREEGRGECSSDPLQTLKDIELRFLDIS
jgi:hypothetical protein